MIRNLLPSLLPLDQVGFRPSTDPDYFQLPLFGAECLGMCGA
jgi:hypothetical protein